MQYSNYVILLKVLLSILTPTSTQSYLHSEKNHQLNGNKKQTAISHKSQLEESIAVAVKLSLALAAQFQVTCSIGGSSRGNTIVTKNNLKSTITLRSRGFYQDSGKIFFAGSDPMRDYDSKVGLYELPPGQATTWYFIKGSNPFGGSKGVMVWQIQDNRKFALVLFYQNPFYSWNFMGACIEPAQPGKSWSKNQLKEEYRKLEGDGHPAWPSNCVLLDNTQTKQLPFYREATLQSNGYKLGLFGKYQYTPHSGDCYNQQLIVVISE